MGKRDMVLIVVITSLVVLLSLTVNNMIYSVADNQKGDLPQVENLAIAIDSADNLHIVWEDGRDEQSFVYEDKRGTLIGVESNIYYAKFDPNGARLVKDSRLTSEGGKYPSIEIDSEDNVWVTYWMNGSFVMKLTTEGEIVLEQRLHNWSENWVTITIGSNDNVYLSWDECGRWCFTYFMRLNGNGDVLTQRTNVSLITPVSGFPIVVDDDGKYLYLGNDGGRDSENNIHIVRESRDYDLAYTKISDIGEIVINNTKASDSRWEYGARVVVDSSDNVHVAGESRLKIGYLKLDDSGGVLKSMTDIRAGKEGAIQLHPDIDVDTSGNAYIVWHVKEVIREYPHTGLRDYAYAGYCSRIESEETSWDNPWIVAKSKKPESSDIALLIAMVLSVLVLIVVFVVFMYFGMTREKRRGGKYGDRQGKR